MHGGHPFNPNDSKDIELLERWKYKSDNGRIIGQYSQAIHCWTESDIIKRETVQKSNLNYLEFWTENEFNKWFESLDNQINIPLKSASGLD